MHTEQLPCSSSLPLFIMDLPIDDIEFDVILRHIPPGPLKDKLKLVKEYKEQGLPYKKILREKHGIVA